MAKGKFEYWISREGLIVLEGWARDGLTDEQISHNMNIAVCTLYDWKKRFPEISEALKKGKEVADYEVENALYRRACGYSYRETKTITNQKGETRTITTKKTAHPDTTAAIFWLKNRRPDVWQRSPEDLDIEDSDAYFAAAEMDPEDPEDGTA